MTDEIGKPDSLAMMQGLAINSRQLGIKKTAPCFAKKNTLSKGYSCSPCKVEWPAGYDLAQPDCIRSQLPKPAVDRIITKEEIQLYEANRKIWNMAIAAAISQALAYRASDLVIDRLKTLKLQELK